MVFELQGESSRGMISSTEEGDSKQSKNGRNPYFAHGQVRISILPFSSSKKVKFLLIKLEITIACIKFCAPHFFVLKNKVTLVDLNVQSHNSAVVPSVQACTSTVP